MRSQSTTPAGTRRRITVALMLSVFGAIGLIEMAGASHLRAHPPATLQATIFKYDGHDFIRTHSTLVTEGGQSAVNTKLDNTSAAYQALVQKHSYTGDATLFGTRYEANYAPLTGPDGQLTGALFIGVPK